MPVSLRVVIAVAMALVVITVAGITLGITLVVSIDAIRGAGEDLAESVATAVTYEVQEYLGVVERHLFVVKNMSKVEGKFILPPDDPSYSTSDSAWGERYLWLMRGFLMEANYTYSAVSMIFDDGSQLVALDHMRQKGWVTEGTQTMRNLTNGTQVPVLYQETYHTVNKNSWDAAANGPPVRALHPTDGRGDGYYYLRNLAGDGDWCSLYPPSVDNNDVGNPRYLMYALCSFKNASGTHIGQFTIGRYLDDIAQFLQKTSKTPNTHIVAADSTGLLLATTLDIPAVQYFEPGVVDVESRTNCMASAGSTIAIGCRARVSDFAYPPLTESFAEDPTFYRAEGRTLKIGTLDGERYYYISQRVPSALRGYSVNILLFMPESDVLGAVNRGRDLAIGLTALVVIIAVVISTVLVGSLLAPLDEVARRMYLTSQLTSDRELTNLKDANAMADEGYGHEYDDFSVNDPAQRHEDAPMAKSSMAEVRALQTAYSTMDTAMRSFTRYVPKDVVKDLMRTNQMCEVEMRPTHCSVLFTDIVGFTSMCEAVHPTQLSKLVRVFFEMASKLVMGHGGVVDKFIGDCIMAVWGAPVPIDHTEIRATICAHMLQYETSRPEIQRSFEEADQVLRICTGINTGEVLAGNMGSTERMSYTVIGDDVNLAARLESLNRQWGTKVLIAESTALECTDYIHLRYIASVAVVGKDKPVKVYEVLAAKADADLTAVGGKATSTASENVTLAEVQLDHDQQEMAARFGDVNATARLLTTAQLLRRAARKVKEPADEIAFAGDYAAAMQHWHRGDFGACRDHLAALAPQYQTRLCVMNITAACESYLKEPPLPGTWNGVWTASKK